MNTTIYLLIGLIVGFGVGFWLGRKKEKGGNDLIEGQANKKEEGKQKILELFSRQNSVTNNDVQNELGISDATATRYLDELEKEGRLKQVGNGHYTHYEKP